MALSVRQLYTDGQEYLKRSGVHDAAFDSRALLSFVMDIPFPKMPLHYQDPVTDTDNEKFRGLLERRASGEPLQYITNEQEFMGLTFYVDERVLIPRLDTEILVETALEYIRDAADKKVLRILDLCCGSGAIGLSIAALSGNSDALSQIGDDAVFATEAKDSDGSREANSGKMRVEVTLTDISSDALEVTRRNAESLGVSDRVTILQGDLLGAVKGKEDFDLIISNPPYIESEVIGTLDSEVKDHEPMLALDGGADGLDIYRRILKEAPAHLAEDGCIMLEIGANQADSIRDIWNGEADAAEAQETLAGAATGTADDASAGTGAGTTAGDSAGTAAGPLTGSFRVRKDLAGLDRVVIIERNTGSDI